MADPATLLAVVAAVSTALVLGALWGLYGQLGDRMEGFVLAAGGGALMLAAVLELIVPASGAVSLGATAAAVMAGAAVFAGVDYLIDERWGDEGGAGLLAAVTLDGVPENLALGVALIGAGFAEIAALAAAIFLSNLPEAAGGARRMREQGWRDGGILALWAGCAVLLGAAALAGNLLLAGAPAEVLAPIRAFAGGAVIASLATEIFPKAYRRDHHMAGIATALGFLAALALIEGAAHG
ncbi:MAG: hypothetical protein OXI22_24130 [Defluviicoccus sp.]|nr:hypothetical protein [Defluviicoccus sp.]MDE0386989.1 hypothetical protein [Defluviicoccus sp.]